ncbi:uncharacterized protein Z520_05347 [Fonsecaea multimorphosa CBS 102226]|uniref:AdoMet activation domain-containing protein n=1 Tax=Fonsecaea multimorphosa CBS 102226 TaxID=1442371 RepID=A0A0D2IPN8_9EURO|nr:uncharacterized protein Z520_05347 [Fonsecaea multimorphosa CBS 102226]KIX98886.1 hypothetical protein Z520_05347 [Fonsecaea multimorphosa CBS 102226]OAL25162.1 hypothetical protein AYO22_05039 [Fonsecaea multimorphosa]
MNRDFNNTVNMTADELEEWLKGSTSRESGWSKGDDSGETIGHESGRKIVELLRKNPEKDPSKYDEEDIAHMRKVAAYNKRHLAQEEEKAKQDPDSKAFRSLRNWGHDAKKS